TTTYSTESTAVTGPTITGQSSSSSSSVSSISTTTSHSSSSSSSISSISTTTFNTEAMTGTGTSIPGWEFLVRIVITGSDAMVSSNLTYTGSQNGTIELGYPIAVTEVKDVNGDVIWGAIST